jgi:DNA (cytosine-5)-methyltransferase 1
MVLVENVPAVLKDKNAVVVTAKTALRSAGFVVADTVVELVGLGVPQRRRRHILLAARGDVLDPVGALEDLGLACAAHPERSVRWAIGDLLQTRPDDEYDRSSSPSAANRARMDWLFTNNAYDLPNQERPPCHRDRDHSYVSMYGRLRWNAPAQTITTGFGSMGQGRFVHPSRRRTLTPHEAARLQTFPDYFSFRKARTRSALTRMIGNAVPPLLGVSLGMVLIPQLRQRYSIAA